jgi:putative ABC transport system permease protein
LSLLRLSFRNAAGNFRRTLTLVFFIFSAAFILILSNILVLTARNKVENVLTNGLCGHVQIRAENSREHDMADQYTGKWDTLRPIAEETAKKLDTVLSEKFPDAAAVRLVRRKAELQSGDNSKDTMLLGLPAGMEKYKEAFLLTEGRYLEPDSKEEILLTQEQASYLGLGIGDQVSVTTKNRYGLNKECRLEVVGIGNFVMLSLFSFNASYTSADVVRELAAYSEYEATDIILYLPDKAMAAGTLEAMAAEMRQKGMDYTIQADEKLTGEDLKVNDVSFEDNDDKAGVKLTTFEEMGENYKASGDAMFIAVKILSAVLLIIVSILILNLVYMTGAERYKEIGTLRAVGFSRGQTILVFMSEIVGVSCISAVSGSLLCAVLAAGSRIMDIKTPIPFLGYILGETLRLDPDPGIFASNLAVILIFSTLAAFLPAYRACSIEPAEAIRTV